jgi:hypothetical protein
MRHRTNFQADKRCSTWSNEKRATATPQPLKCQKGVEFHTDGACFKNRETLRNHRRTNIMAKVHKFRGGQILLARCLNIL